MFVPSFLTGSFQILRGCKKESLEPSLLRAEQPQVSPSVVKGERETCMEGALLGPLGSNLAAEVLPRSVRHGPAVQKAWRCLGTAAPKGSAHVTARMDIQQLSTDLHSSEPVCSIPFLNVFRCSFQKCSWAGPCLSSGMGMEGQLRFW